MADVVFKIEVDSGTANAKVLEFSGNLEDIGEKAEKGSKKSVSAFERMEAILGKMRSAVIGFIGAFLFREAIMGFNEIIQAGITFETTFAGIRKTVEETATVSFRDLSDGMRRLAIDIPIGVDNLNKIGAVAGTLGVPTGKILEFTKTIAKIGLVSSLSTEEAAESFARLSNIMGLDISNVKSLASVTVRLGNETAASEREIIAFSLRIAGAAKQVGMTTPEIEAMSATMASVGLRAESAGSATSTMLKNMDKAVRESNAHLTLFAQVAGMAPEEFAKHFRASAATAVLEFMTGLGKLKDNGDSAAAALEQLGLKNIRVQDMAIRTGEAVTLFNQSLVTARDEAGKAGEALENAFGKRMATARVELDRSWARIHDVAISLSDELTPALAGAADKLASMAEFLRDYNGTVFAVIGAITAFIGVMGLMAFSKWIMGITAFTEVFKVLNLVAFTSLDAITMSIGGATIAIAGLAAVAATAAVTFYKMYDAEMKLRDAEVDAEKAQGKMMDTIRKSLIDLQNHGHVVTDIEIRKWGLIGAIQEHRRQLAEEKKVLDEGTKSLNLKSEAEKKLTEEHKRAVDAMVESMDHTKGASVMEDSIQQAMKSGTTMSRIVDELGKKALEMRNDLIDTNKSVAAGISEVAALYESSQSDKAVAKLREELEKLENAGTAAHTAMIAEAQTFDTSMQKAWESGQTLGEITDRDGKRAVELRDKFKIFGEQAPEWVMRVAGAMDMATLSTNMLKDAVDAIDAKKIGDMINGIAGNPDFPTLIGLNPNDTNQNMFNSAPTLAPGAQTKKEIKEYKEEIAGLSKAFDKLFDQMVKKGKLVWKDMANFALEVFEPMLNKLFTPLKKSITDILQEPLGHLGDTIQSQITKHISSPVTDAAGKLFGDKVGKALGGVAGGLASAGIGAAIGIGIQLLGKLLGKSGSEVNNNLVKNIQNPFTKAVGNINDSFFELQKAGKLTLESAVASREALAALLDKFKKDAEAYAATGAKQATAVKGMFDTISQYWGEDLTVIFSKMDEAIKALGGTAGLTTEGLKALESSLEAINQFNEAVGSITSSVHVSSSEVEIMAAALQQLKDEGTPAGIIIARLGSDIYALTSRMKDAGMSIPDIINYYDLMIRKQNEFEIALQEWTDKMDKAKSRLEAVNSELAQVDEQLKAALISKLELLERQLKTSADSIQSWKDKVVSINADISEAATRLEDTTYWQNRYNDVVKESEDNLKSLTNKRIDIEKQIADLTKQIEEDRLNAIIKNSKNASIIKAAELQLTRLQNSGTADHIAQLAELKKQLPEIIRLEDAAANALENKKIQAIALIEQEKALLEKSIASKLLERAAIEGNIDVETQHVAQLMIQQAAVIAQMAIFGAVRQSEIEKIDQTINSLIRRKEALEGERVALESLIATLVGTQPVQEITPIMRNVRDIEGGVQRLFPTLNGEPYLGTADMYPSRTFTTSGQVSVRAGETISHSSTSTGISIGKVDVNISVSGAGSGTQAGEDAAEAFLRKLETEASVRSRAKRALK